ESVLLISFEILIGEQSFLMNICFATFAFDNILAKLSTQKLSSIRAAKYFGITAKEVLEAHLAKTLLPLQVEFGRTKLSIQELMEMKVGDIVRLETKLSDDQQVRTGTQNLFSGRIGIANNHKAIKITRKVIDEPKSL
ncbi:MAG: FliM/FliN family flagellar motor switch protein, partial [Melioribacteraceae bacterium]